jgi:hypothetical protein
VSTMRWPRSTDSTRSLEWTRSLRFDRFCSGGAAERERWRQAEAALEEAHAERLRSLVAEAAGECHFD